MADNVAITAGTGTTIAADDIGAGVLAQRVKLVLGVDGTGVDAIAGNGAMSTAVQRVCLATDSPGVTTLGQAAMSASLPTTLASDQTALGKSVHLTSAPAVTAGSYTTGQVVGGLVSLTSAARYNAGSGLIQQVQITVKTALTQPYDVFFFDTNPTNSTFTDNNSLALNVADLPFCVGVAHCSDLVSCGTPQLLQASNCAIPFKLSAAATTLYAVIVIRGSQSFASTSAIQLTVGLIQD